MVVNYSMLHILNRYSHICIFFLFIIHYIKKIMIHDMIQDTEKQNKKIQDTYYELTTMIVTQKLLLRSSVQMAFM